MLAQPGRAVGRSEVRLAFEDEAEKLHEILSILGNERPGFAQDGSRSVPLLVVVVEGGITNWHCEDGDQGCVYPPAAPALGGIYKLVEIERDDVPVPVMKLSGGKASYPGRKQVWRRGRHGVAYGDVIGLEDEPGPADGQPLLVPVMRRGERLLPREPLETLRARHREALDLLPSAVRMLHVVQPYPVVRSVKLEALTDYVMQALRE